MSVKVMAFIWDHFPQGGGAMLTALKLADHADHDGGSIFPSVAGIAKNTRQSERTVQYHLRAMEEAGWLLPVSAGGGRRRTATYRIPIERIPQDVRGTVQILHLLYPPAQEHAETVQPVAPFPEKGCNPEHETVQSTTLNGATAIAPESSVPVIEPSGKAPRAPKSKQEYPDIQEPVRAWAAKHGFGPFLALHHEHFRDYLLNRVGKPYADLDAAFRTCIRADWGDVRRQAQRGAPPQGSTAAAAPKACQFRERAGADICGGAPARATGAYGGKELCEHHREKLTARGAPMPDALRSMLRKPSGVQA